MVNLTRWLADRITGVYHPNGGPLRRRQLVEQNQRAWNSVAGQRDELRDFPGGAFFRDGGTTLGRIELDVLGDVAGKQLLHLGCASGGDTLSWALEGAIVTGVDISDVAVNLARQKAAQAGLDARFIQADLADLDHAVGPSLFDVVYVKAGVLCWVPDIASLAKAVSKTLHEGGRLLIYELHPLALVVDADEGRISVGSDYFGRGRPELVEEALLTGVPTIEPRYQFTWPLGDVVTALTAAGLSIDRLTEFPGDRSPMEMLPSTFLLVAHKPKA